MLRAVLTISRKSPEKIKLGVKPFIRSLVKYGHVLAPAQRSALRLAANKPTKPVRAIPQCAVVPRISTGDNRSWVGSLNHSCLFKEINVQTYVFHRSRWPFALSRSGACRRDGTDCGIMRSARSSSSQGGSRGNDSQRHCGRHRDQGKRAAPVAERGGQRRGDKVRAVGEIPLTTARLTGFWRNSDAASRSTVTARQRSRCTGVAWLAQEAEERGHLIKTHSIAVRISSARAYCGY